MTTFSIIIEPFGPFEEYGEGTFDTVEEATDDLVAAMSAYEYGDVLTIVNDQTGEVVFKKTVGAD